MYSAGAGSAQGRTAAVSSSLYSGSHLLETINNYTYYFSSSSEGQALWETPSYTFPFSLRPITTALENSERPWDVQASMFLLLCLLNVYQVLLRVNQLF